MAIRSSEQLLSFLVLLLLCAPAAGCIDRERQALLQFKRGLVDGYGILSSWGDEQDKRDCCRWRGVRCSNGSGSVVMLQLPAPPINDDLGHHRSLRGEISPSLRELKHLTHLDLSHNNFLLRQMPPFLGSLRKMQYLNLSNTNFGGTIPTQLGNLSDLLSLDLSDNYALQSGGLKWLSHLSSLRFLDLRYVDLASAIHWPKVINQLALLVYVNLRGCGLPEFTSESLIHTNSSPPLVFLDLSNNDVIGSSIFPWLFSFSTTLVHLNLASSYLNGLIPQAFGSMTSLTYLDLRECELKGEIPSTLGAMGALEYLDFSMNGLHGEIPDTFGNMTSLAYLNLEGCALEGEIPSALGAMGALEYLDFSVNGLHGEIPDTFGNMTSLAYLNLRECALQGEIPSALEAMGALEYLDISGNRLHGEIPDLFGNMTSLTYLDLASNQLEGRIPDTIGDLASLTYLDLHGNQLTALPRAFGVSLVRVDVSSNQLQGSILNTLDNAVSLVRLNLHDNRLEGEIPKSLGRSLAFLDLASNKLQGEIPKYFRNLCNLVELELNGNNLSGQLPPDFLACANRTLVTLSLSGNWFRGSVPHFTGFSYLEELSLGFNQFNGTLPESIGQLGRLAWFDIGSNSLQGTISEAHFHNLSSLYHLDLSHNSLITFNLSSEWVPPFQQLRNLLLASCKLGPAFPSWLQTQKLLEELDLSSSDISDDLPDWFWNLTSFFHALNISNNQIRGVLPDLSSQFGYYPDIDISSNRFEGSVPRLPSSVTRLDLSNNKFSGSISLLCQEANSYMVYFDLSNNSLTGTLPDCWQQWENLAVLNLENNKFFGRIPSSLGSLQWIQTLHLP